MSYPPVTFDVDTPDRIANWRPLVHWLLAIPHLVIVYFLNILSSVVAVISWFAILFTGRLPQGLATLQVMLLRYPLRAQMYMYFLYSSYPPFDFTNTSEEPGGSPVTYSVTPALEGRNRLTVLFRIILVIPALLFTLAIGIVGAVCLLLGFFAVLFTGRWPESLRTWVMNATRVAVRTNVYLYLLTDEYPPFSVESTTA